MKSAYLLLFAAALSGQSAIDRAAAKAGSKVNPYEGSANARQAGEKLYRRACASCHARSASSGKAPRLDRPEVISAPPGALMWILRNGSIRRGMPSFAHLPEQQRWQIATFLRSL